MAVTAEQFKGGQSREAQSDHPRPIVDPVRTPKAVIPSWGHPKGTIWQIVTGECRQATMIPEEAELCRWDAWGTAT